MYSIVALISPPVPQELAEQLVKYYSEMKQNYFMGRYGPSEVDGGKLTETVVRILEWMSHATYTPISVPVNLDGVSKDLEANFKGKIPDSLRLQLPRTLRAVYEVRSHRGAAHTSGINPSLMDSTFVASACDWIVAEIVRFFTGKPPDEVQKIVDTIVQRKAPIVEEFDGGVLVLDPSLSVADHVLLILYHRYPDYVLSDDFKKWIHTKTPGHVATVLLQLEERRLIYRRDGKDSKLTRSGLKYVEDGFVSGRFRNP